MPRRLAATAALCLAGALALPRGAAAQAQPSPAAASNDIVRVRAVPTRQMRDIRSLRLVRDTVTLRLGDTLDLDRIAVLGFGASGDTMGVVRLFDYTSHPDTLRSIAAHRLVAVRPGTTGVTIEVSQIFWRSRDLPQPKVRLVIIVTDATSPP